MRARLDGAGSLTSNLDVRPYELVAGGVSKNWAATLSVRSFVATLRRIRHIQLRKLRVSGFAMLIDAATCGISGLEGLDISCRDDVFHGCKNLLGKSKWHPCSRNS